MPGPMVERPTSVVRATQLVQTMVALGLAITVLVVIFRDELLEAWSAGQPSDSTIQPPAFVPVAIVLFVVFAVLTLVLLSFVGSGHNWARHSLAAAILAVGLAALAAIRTNPPALFVVCSIVLLVLEAVILFYLYHRDTNRYVGPRLVGTGGPD